MGTAQQTPYFFKPKPLFGLDIGVGSLKVVQISSTTTASKAKPASLPPASLLGYGSTTFDPAAIVDGVITQPEIVAAAAQKLFKQHLIGDISTHRVAMAIPAYRTFIRSMQLPVLKPRERAEAIQLEAEQYLPVPLSDVYMDYTTITEAADTMEVLAVAVPRNIVDSYLELGALMGVEPVLVETTMNAAARLFQRDPQSNIPSVIIDFGTLSSDISIYNQGLVTTGTVEGGGQDFANAIKKSLKVSAAEANIIKTKYGLNKSKRQAEIKAALDPILEKILKEIKRLVRYHAERYGEANPIQQIITIGGGANLPGLNEYFTSSLRLATRSCDPWQYVTANRLQVPNHGDRSMYATALGSAFAPFTEVFK